MNKEEFFKTIHHKLIVSCQALEDEPLHGAEIMAKMAQAAKEGGACAIRSNSAVDVAAIKKQTGLPVIGLVKRDYPDSEVFITATLKEVKELLEVGVDVIALDATVRKRPNGENLKDLVTYIHEQSDTLVMADIATVRDAEYAIECNVDMIGTTLSGYTDDSPKLNGPDFDLVRELCNQSTIPVIAEGRVNTPEQAREMIKVGAWSVVVGSAITRPQLITKSFVEGLEK
ncbi:N-acetylmannosamine-6-phosphate 2-epimerase [Pseudogracilibacillus auburnensis]|uniref:N-acetylmannosamine-6-phosphate 2-epimerase n=1 Tax=Pseudogracilibacillus auburnensis TaxID=1494959 RepID=UPI001A978ACD|nr:N-acetylmannosamine-6-phosphate 2-epimerase [Pseudogracilibacillus auburnensis]MBO1004817.1 N-acetylmannosamine-6-phosphate 2-epimerase [Pseudogracilibacillus auburnensis]